MTRSWLIEKLPEPLWRAAITIACLLLPGCGSAEALERYPVSGTVTIDGVPIERALLTFIPAAPTRGPKVTATASHGAYQLKAVEGPCAGEFLVKIETIPYEIEAIASGTRIAEVAQQQGRDRPEVAPEFNRESRIRVTVEPGGENRFDFEVKSVN